jgi:hypothetical protein
MNRICACGSPLAGHAVDVLQKPSLEFAFEVVL